MTVVVIGYRDTPPQGYRVVETTSRSKQPLSRQLSPFFLGPVDLYDGYTSKNVENGWQYSKVYAQHIDDCGNPSPAYFDWAKKGWNDTYAQRYPMGKGAIPEYSYWEGIKYTYIEARAHIYIPLYVKAAIKTKAWERLFEAAKNTDIALLDFDGYNNKALGVSYHDVLYNPKRKMGHAFVLAMMLDGFIDY